MRIVNELFDLFDNRGVFVRVRSKHLAERASLIYQVRSCIGSACDATDLKRKIHFRHDDWTEKNAQAASGHLSVELLAGSHLKLFAVNRFFPLESAAWRIELDSR